MEHLNDNDYKDFREYINKKHGNIFRTQEGFNTNPYLDNIRNQFMDEWKEEPPCFMVSVSYFRETKDLKTIHKNNQRINAALEDLFNTRNKPRYCLLKSHFIESRKDQLKKVSPIKVKNTITQEYEIDFNAIIVSGSFDTHHLIGPILDEVIEKPNRKIKKAYQELYPYGIPPEHYLEEPGYIDLKLDLIEYTLRNKCYDFIGTSEQSLNVLTVDERKSYDGFSGWRGLVAYVTKQITGADNYLIVFDKKNSNVIPQEGE